MLRFASSCARMLIASVTAALVAGCAFSEVDELEESASRDDAVQSKVVEAEGCGYRCDPVVKRHPSCGVELFNVGTDMQCPGSMPYGTKTITVKSGPRCRGTDRAPNCPAGFIDRGVRVETGGACEFGDSADWLRWEVRTCVNADRPASCRAERFGVELFAACDVVSDPCVPGAEGYMGWARCEVLLTRGELQTFLEANRAWVQASREAYISLESQVRNGQKNQSAAACIIQRYSGRVSPDLIDKLKRLFESEYGVAYEPSLCTASPAPMPSCAADDSSKLCTDYRAFERLAGQFRALKEEIRTIREWLARWDAPNPDVRARYDELEAELETLIANYPDDLKN